ncbi:MAG: hypothetical protein ACPIOQ_72520, partial [Promethearchaeia archaeon]
QGKLRVRARAYAPADEHTIFCLYAVVQTIEDAMDKAKKAEDKLASVGQQIVAINAAQTRDDGRILTLNGKADDQKNDNDKNWKDVLDMIQQEGDLFSKIAKKLKDEDLRKDVDTVFERRAPSTQ